jgi:hypothetical protein
MRIEQGAPHPPLLIPNFQDTVTVRGGAYFFLPSITALRYLGTTDGRKQR